MEKGVVGGRMNGWEKLITEEGTRTWVLGGCVCLSYVMIRSFTLS